MIITDVNEFGRCIRDRRKKLNYTQGYVAQVTGFSTSFISDLENGKTTAELGKALYLANILGMDISVHERDN